MHDILHVIFFQPHTHIHTVQVQLVSFVTFELSSASVLVITYMYIHYVASNKYQLEH